jgi:hypothetical protein
MSVTEDDMRLTYLGYGIMFAIIFGLIAGTVVVAMAEQNKINLVFGQGLYIENRGDGSFNIVDANQGIGTLYSNLPLGLALPPGQCYKLFINQTSQGFGSVRLDFQANPASIANCGGSTQNITTTQSTFIVPQNQSLYYYRDETGFHVAYGGRSTALNTTLLPSIPLDTCYVLTITVDIAAKQVNVETAPTELHFCELS